MDTISLKNGQRLYLECKSTFWQKLRGLLRVKYLSKNAGIVLVKCKQIHTFGMRFSLDIIVLDKNGKIINFLQNFPPNKISRYYRQGYYIIELATNKNNLDLLSDSQFPSKFLNFIQDNK